MQKMLLLTTSLRHPLSTYEEKKKLNKTTATLQKASLMLSNKCLQTEWAEIPRYKNILGKYRSAAFCLPRFNESVVLVFFFHQLIFSYCIHTMCAAGKLC